MQERYDTTTVVINYWATAPENMSENRVDQAGKLTNSGDLVTEKPGKYPARIADDRFKDSRGMHPTWVYRDVPAYSGGVSKWRDSTDSGPLTSHRIRFDCALTLLTKLA